MATAAESVAAATHSTSDPFGTSRFPVIHREGAEHRPIRRQDRRGPARPQPVRQRKLRKSLPVRMGADVLDDHRLPEIGRRAAGAVLRSDRLAVEQTRVFRGKAGCGAITQAFLFLVDQQD